MVAPRPGLRVLVVDDNHLIRRLLALILEGAGFEPVEAESGADALALAGVTPPDLWLVDEAMPGMTGSELVRLVRRCRDRRLAGAPVVGISGREGASADLLAAGCDVFVEKPIEEQRVIEALVQAVRVRRDLRPGAAPAR